MRQIVRILDTLMSAAFFGMEQSVNFSHSGGENPSSSGIDLSSASISARKGSEEAAMCCEKSKLVGSPAVCSLCLFQLCWCPSFVTLKAGTGLSRRTWGIRHPSNSMASYIPVPSGGL